MTPHTFTLTAGQYEAAARLNLTVRSVGNERVVVVCPYCGGERHITAAGLAGWGIKRKVPTCEAVRRANRGTHCRSVPPPAHTTEAAS